MKLISFVKKLITSFILLGGILFTQFSYAETIVVVHPNNSSSLSSKDIQRLFLVKSKTFPNGDQAIPIDQDSANDDRKSFISAILKKNKRKIKKYWARQVFTGKGIPPKVVGTPEAVKDFVSKNPSAIGYIDASMLDSSLKVVHRF